MRAAIYARKSTDDKLARSSEGRSVVDDDTRSVPRQVHQARQFIDGRRWSISEHHIYTDDGVSGALFEEREQFQRMMRDAASRSFDVLVVFDLDRLGRHGSKTMSALNRLEDLGVEVWDSSSQRRIELDSFESRFPTVIKSEFAQWYREQARKHTRASQRHLFTLGYVVGCRIYGYDNVKVDGRHARRRKNAAEASVVLEIFERYARGEGYKSIAWQLNQRGVPAPRAQRGRPNGWEPSTIRAVLDRTIYRGIEWYGRSRKAYGGKELGSRRRRHDGSDREKGQVPEHERTLWLNYASEELRIVSPALAAAVDARRGDRESRYLRSANGRLIGRPSTARYLLSGLLKCPCGGSMEALKGGNWSHKGAVYVCGARRRKGPSVCPHELALPIEAADEAILAVIEESILHPAFYEDVVLEAVLRVPQDDKREALEQDRKRLHREIENLTLAIARGGDIPQLVDRLKERERALRKVESALVPTRIPERAVLADALKKRASDWKVAMRQNVAQARAVLQQLVALPLTLHTEHDRPRWLAQPRPEGLLVGMVQELASPPGFEPGFWP